MHAKQRRDGARSSGDGLLIGGRERHFNHGIYYAYIEKPCKNSVNPYNSG
ncbi:MAG: hypothetical protein OEV49_01755 [candidate division Zixibacteria bacterium]|nr:hypothetical protein [candidate division Zixibacteria bacterium]MDH3938870.1 hypothetical protein [candidate division Zixibacteria bacterium]MDH4032248.1 hypothetical protein [candidate division Zixibacteria bacterium]